MSDNAAPVEAKNKIVALILCIFLGGLGIHRFYVGKIGTGILWLLTGGLFGIGWIVDIIMIAVGSFKDKSGAALA
jgi:TM2 domain-containing membrane protein YozV